MERGKACIYKIFKNEKNFSFFFDFFHSRLRFSIFCTTFPGNTQLIFGCFSMADIEKIGFFSMLVKISIDAGVKSVYYGIIIP